MIDITTLSESDLEDMLSEPTEQGRTVTAALKGDIIVLGAGGKIGPTLAMMLKKAAPDKTIYAVSRFTNQAVKAHLENAGVKTIQADLLEKSSYENLPVVDNIFYLAGMKFGTTGNQPLTWALNSFLPGTIAQYYKDSKIVVLSTGNVYPYVDTACGRVREDTSPAPVGEYAQSCLGRERICQYFSEQNNTPMTIIRLNYANEPRYGIIVDLTLKIIHYEPIELSIPAVNLIWQRDANDYIARSITLAQSPPRILNVTGPETIIIRELANQIGKIINKEPRFTVTEGTTCLLSDASYCFERLGFPETGLQEMLSMIVPWVASGKPILNKPTKYDVSDGKF